jgi:hypothetical protein
MSAQIIRALNARADALDREADQLDDTERVRAGGASPAHTASEMQRWLAAEFRDLATEAEKTG